MSLTTLKTTKRSTYYSNFKSIKRKINNSEFIKRSPIPTKPVSYLTRSSNQFQGLKLETRLLLA